MLLATKVSERANLIGIVDWRIAELERLGVTIRTHCYAELAEVLAEAPDAVFIATGGLPDLDWLNGKDLCHSTWDILSGSVAPRPKIVIFDGTGRAAAPSAALLAAQHSNAVTFVTRDSVLGQEMPYQDNTGFRRRFVELGIQLVTDQTLTRVEQCDGKLVSTFSGSYGGPPLMLDADQVIVEHGTQPLNDLYDTLNTTTDYRGTAFLIGDAVASRDIHASVRESHRMALEV